MKKLLKGKHFLVVEDEETNWFLIRDILEGFKATVTWADVGQKAIDRINNGEKFDAILMDIQLPLMNGKEVTRRLKAIDPNICIVAQTAFTLNDDISACYMAGCSAHICKPFTPLELTSTLVRVLYK